MPQRKLPQSLQGIVVKFKGNGRKLGYPTANIASSTTLGDGVYFGYADLRPYVHHPALIFIGTPTTVGDTTRRVEAHLLDITDQDYYGRGLTLRLEYFHRANQTFKSVDELLLAMNDDKHSALLWFKQHQFDNRPHPLDS